jgi:hypothetical protein
LGQEYFQGVLAVAIRQIQLLRTDMKAVAAGFCPQRRSV